MRRGPADAGGRGHLWTEVRVHPFTFVDPEAAISETGLVGTIINVTERKQAELELLEANRMLSVLSRFDSLTGVANRRFFDERLAAEWKRARDNDSPISLIMLDIDFFKEYNDLLGHQMGDRCLAAVAEAMSELLERPADLAARYGGEEFGIILPDTDRDAAYALAENIRSRIERLSMAHPGSAVHRKVTVSLGLATLRQREASDPSELIELADHALYAAKQQGRNKVEVAS